MTVGVSVFAITDLSNLISVLYWRLCQLVRVVSYIQQHIGQDWTSWLTAHSLASLNIDAPRHVDPSCWALTPRCEVKPRILKQYDSQRGISA
jgi:hypothetical protein